MQEIFTHNCTWPLPVVQHDKQYVTKDTSYLWDSI